MEKNIINNYFTCIFDSLRSAEVQPGCFGFTFGDLSDRPSFLDSLIEPYMTTLLTRAQLSMAQDFNKSICAVSVSDVEAIREGHQSEVLLSIADEFPADRCFMLVFRGRRSNLDLVAESAEEAQSWIRGMRKLIENLENMGEREKLDQYLSLGLQLYVVESF